MAGFDDGKDDGALRTIGELGHALGIKTHVLRYWEGQFPMLQPLKRSGGRRYYRPEDIALVREIDRLVNREGYTLRGAKAALAHFRGSAPVSEVTVLSPSSAATISDRAESSLVPSDTIAKLRAVRQRLAEALAI